MKRFFYKSEGLILFASVVSFILTSGSALARSLKQSRPQEINDVGLILTLVTGVTLLLLLNAVDITELWLRGKKQELNVKNFLE